MCVTRLLVTSSSCVYVLVDMFLCGWVGVRVCGCVDVRVIECSCVQCQCDYVSTCLYVSMSVCLCDCVFLSSVRVAM